MHIGEIRKICQLQDEGQSLMRASRAMISTQSVKLACAITDLVGSDEIQSAHLRDTAM